MIPSRQHPKRRVKSWVPATAVLAVGAVALIWFLTGLPVKIKRVRISGLRSISQAQLEQIAGIKPGMDVGRNQALDIGKALVKHPLILEASVDAGVTGTLHIRIRERTPVAWLENRSCAIGADGVLLAGIGERDESWLRLAGLQVEKGRVREIGARGQASSRFG
jgi:cell division septal protein FtsQ